MASSFVRIAAASTAMGGFLWATARVVPESAYAGWPGAGLLAVVIGLAAACYWLAAHLLGAPEPAQLRRVASRRRR